MQARYLFIASVLIFVGGCLPVSDLGPFWQQGFVDKSFNGDWMPDNNGLNPVVSILFDGNEATIKPLFLEAVGPDTPAAKCKSLKIGNSTYLMLMADNATNQQPRWAYALIRYKLENDKLVFSSINPEQINRAIEDKSIDSKIGKVFTGDANIALPILNEKLCKFLANAEQEPNNWTEAMQYKKTDNVKAYLENQAKLIQQMHNNPAPEPYNPGYKGQVVDEKDKPIEEAKISLVVIKNLEGKNPNDDTQIIAETVTDVNGAFHIDYEPDTNQTIKLILAEKTGYSTAWYDPQFKGIDNVKMVVKKAELLQGVVKNLDGVSVPGAIVHAIPVSENDEYYLENENIGLTKQFTAITDGSGKFAISQMCKDQYYRFKIYVEGFYEQTYAAKYKTDANNIVVIREIVGVKLKFQEPKTGAVAKNLNFEIHGIVRPDKKDIWDSSSTSEQGIAELKLAPGDYTIEYRAEEKTEYGFYTQSFSVVKNTPLLLDIDTFKTGTLEITVLNSDTGEPMGGVNLSKNGFRGNMDEITKSNLLTSPIGFSHSTNEDGKAFFYLPDGETVVEFLHHNQTTMPVNLKCSVKAGETLAVKLIFGAELSGVVKDSNGAVVPNAKVWIYPDSNNCVYTDSNGQFAISKSLIDKVQSQNSQTLGGIIVFVTSQNTNQAATFEYKIGESLRQIILSKAITKIGTVKDKEGNPIVGAKVSIGTLARPGVYPISILYQDEYTSQTNSEGIFQIPCIPALNYYYCKISKEGYLLFLMQIGSSDGTYRDKNSYEDLEITMQKISPQNQLAGYFSNIFCDNPVGVKVKLVSKVTDAVDFTATVDANGYYSFENIGIERQNYKLTYNLNDRGAVESNFPSGEQLDNIPETGDVNVLSSFYVGERSEPAKIPAGMGLLELEILEADTNNTAFYSIARIQKHGIANDITPEMNDNSKIYMLVKAGIVVIKSVEPSFEAEANYIKTIVDKEIMLKDGQITKEKVFIQRKKSAAKYNEFPVRLGTTETHGRASLPNLKSGLVSEKVVQ